MIRCETCQHFQPGRINPEAGMGQCGHEARHGHFYPMELHCCYDHAQIGAERVQKPRPPGSPHRDPSP